MLRWPLRSSCALFPVKQIRGLVSRRVLASISGSVAHSEIFLKLCPAGLKYCSAVWCSAADSHLKLLVRTLKRAKFLAGGVLECNLVHRRSVSVLCMPCKIKSNHFHPLSFALPLLYVPARVTRGVWLLIGTRLPFLAVELLSIADPLYPYQCLFGTILPCVWWCGTVDFQEQNQCFPVGLICFIFCLLLFSLFLPSMGWLCVVGVFGLVECSHLLPTLQCWLNFNNNNNNNNWYMNIEYFLTSIHLVIKARLNTKSKW